MQQKEKFTIEQQINYMKTQNIKFRLYDEEKAAKFLAYSNYYFKIKSFAKNFTKIDEKYKNLDFAYLRKFSILDTAFRELVLELSLLCEHLIKVLICRSCSQNDNDDGYVIVQKYVYNHGLPSAINRYDKKTYSDYSKSLLDKYRSNMPIWVLVEILDFGELISFYKFYQKSYDIDNKVSDFNLYTIKSLRNIAAHNSCVLHTLTMHPTKRRTSTTLKKFLHKEIPSRNQGEIKIPYNKNILSRKENEIKIPLIHDFLCLIFVFSELCPNTEIKRILTKKIIAYFKKCEERSEYFNDEPFIVKRYIFVKKATYKILRNK
ncbi:Abi family protein [Campylobacter lanienae]|uniref:Abi family protein n=1 Tax=Campylobacter lanienae TaxID=75658 RepID=UPI00242C5BB7|nr:Abi family protein [Campylobacter lanienae]MCI5539609.1 Abi family protein [Campylobacter lanienae]MDD7514320.1 Abi family protein [Campylobacter lanienae]MDY5518674.1 Abi family protein [Campylobacter lanienae]